jgi:hypothetical protein
VSFFKPPVTFSFLGLNILLQCLPVFYNGAGEKVFLKSVICRLILTKASHMYKHYESNAVYFSWFSMYLVYQVPEYGAVAPQRDGR